MSTLRKEHVYYTSMGTQLELKPFLYLVLLTLTCNGFKLEIKYCRIKLPLNVKVSKIDSPKASVNNPITKTFADVIDHAL